MFDDAGQALWLARAKERGWPSRKLRAVVRAPAAVDGAGRLDEPENPSTEEPPKEWTRRQSDALKGTPALRAAYDVGAVSADIANELLRLPDNRERLDALAVVGRERLDGDQVRDLIARRLEAITAAEAEEAARERRRLEMVAAEEAAERPVREMEAVADDSDLADILGIFRRGEFPAYGTLDEERQARLRDAVRAIAARRRAEERVLAFAAAAGVPTSTPEQVEAAFQSAYWSDPENDGADMAAAGAPQLPPNGEPPEDPTPEHDPRAGGGDASVECQARTHALRANDPEGVPLRANPSGASAPDRGDAALRQPRPGAAICLKGAAIGRKPEAGPQYGEVLEDVSFTLNCMEVHAVLVPAHREDEGDGGAA